MTGVPKAPTAEDRMGMAITVLTGVLVVCLLFGGLVLKALLS